MAQRLLLDAPVEHTTYCLVKVNVFHVQKVTTALRIHLNTLITFVHPVITVERARPICMLIHVPVVHLML